MPVLKKTPHMQTYTLHTKHFGHARAVVRGHSEPGDKAFELDAQVIVNGRSIDERTYTLSNDIAERTDAFRRAIQWANARAQAIAADGPR